jgi:murein DD-endopeptidase MepM/ murein hydrolase activator NlpD
MVITAPGRPRSPARSRPAAVAVALLLATLSAVALSAVALTVAAPASGAGDWTWPLSPRPAVVGDWAPPAQRWDRGHRGVDLGAGPDAVVRSPAAGTVAFVGVVVDRPVLTIDHGGGLRSSFEPVESTLVRGQRVHPGQVVGLLRGRDHCRDGQCLHWGVRRGDAYVNPLQFVGALEPSVLLPVPEELGSAAQPWPPS